MNSAVDCMRAVKRVQKVNLSQKSRKNYLGIKNGSILGIASNPGPNSPLSMMCLILLMELIMQLARFGLFLGQTFMYSAEFYEKLYLRTISN